MKKFNHSKGAGGESLAHKLLIDKGYRVLERNFRTRFGEIDLICVDGDTLVFVEVKLKTGEDFGTPEEMINQRKLSKVQRMAEVFIQRGGSAKLPEIYRIDVVAIVLDEFGGVKRIDHYKNAASDV